MGHKKKIVFNSSARALGFVEGSAFLALNHIKYAKTVCQIHKMILPLRARLSIDDAIIMLEEARQIELQLPFSDLLQPEDHLSRSINRVLEKLAANQPDYTHPNEMRDRLGDLIHILEDAFLKQDNFDHEVAKESRTTYEDSDHER